MLFMNSIISLKHWSISLKHNSFVYMIYEMYGSKDIIFPKTWEWIKLKYFIQIILFQIYQVPMYKLRSTLLKNSILSGEHKKNIYNFTKENLRHR